MSQERKDDHVRLATAQHRLVPTGAGTGGGGTPGRASDFDFVRPLHHALSGGDRSQVSLAVAGRELRWPVPLYLNGMTGGSRASGSINRELAIAARETGLPMATGSLSAAFRDPGLLETFTVVRRMCPDGFVMANLSASATPAQARQAVEWLSADALQLHANAAQETVMPEGDRDLTGWVERIAEIVDAVAVPVIVKEVGSGLSGRAIAQSVSAGASAVDVSGRGGTDFVAVESQRRSRGEVAYLAGWGLSTVESLLEGAPSAGEVDILASGGVRHPLDAVRALALGALAVGVAGGFLRILIDDGVSALIAEIAAWLEQIGDIMNLLGARTPADLWRTDLLLTSSVREFCELRGIDAARYARRSGQGI